MLEWARSRPNSIPHFGHSCKRAHTFCPCTQRCMEAHKAQSSSVPPPAVTVETAWCRVTVVWKPANEKLWSGSAPRTWHTQWATRSFQLDFIIQWLHDRSVSFHHSDTHTHTDTHTTTLCDPHFLPCSCLSLSHLKFFSYVTFIWQGYLSKCTLFKITLWALSTPRLCWSVGLFCLIVAGMKPWLYLWYWPAERYK